MASIYARLAKGLGFDSGPRMAAALTTLDANFGKLEPSIKDSAAANYVPVDGDKVITRSNGGAQTLTLPTNVAVPFPIGYPLEVINTGGGVLTLVAPAGGAINKLAAKALTVAIGGTVKLRKTAANTWYASGDLT